jgi:uncharacterized phage infection (PIP) family protein YhgE
MERALMRGRKRSEPRGAVRRVTPILVVSTTLAVVAAGCGASPEQKWFDSVCADMGDWRGEIQQSADNVRGQLQSPRAGTLAAIDAEARQVVNATDKLAADLRALGPPDTESGAQAKQQLDALASQLETTVAAWKQAVESVPSGAGAAETAQKLAPLVAALQSLATTTSSTLASIETNGTKLKEGFEKADSCEQFR